jgi:four helix bundle protein
MPTNEGYGAWEMRQNDVTTRDAVWSLVAYRKSCYLQEIAWPDVCRLTRVRLTRSVADQLYDAVGSICANISEGFSRSSPRDRCRMYEYALGSARECVAWYRGARPVLGGELVAERHALLQEIIRLLLTMIGTDRGRR